jgi:hypothetical protein
MINFDVMDFIDSVETEEYQVYYDGKVYQFVCGTYVENGDIIKANLFVFAYLSCKYINGRTEDEKQIDDKPIFDTFQPTFSICMEVFLKAPIWNGKTFWEVHEDMGVYPL